MRVAVIGAGAAGCFLRGRGEAAGAGHRDDGLRGRKEADGETGAHRRRTLQHHQHLRVRRQPPEGLPPWRQVHEAGAEALRQPRPATMVRDGGSALRVAARRLRLPRKPGRDADSAHARTADAAGGRGTALRTQGAEDCTEKRYIRARICRRKQGKRRQSGAHGGRQQYPIF